MIFENNERATLADSLDGLAFEQGYEYLGPEYDEERHGAYLDMLTDALNDSRCLNVALSGPYGCGKSSILEEYRRRNQKSTLAVSLWSLTSQSGDSEEPSHEVSTGRIEQEIVRQIMYSGKHRKMPYSRFNRIHPVGRFCRAAYAVLIAFLVFLGVLIHDEGLVLELFSQAPSYLPNAMRACYYFVIACLAVHAAIPWIAGHLRGGKISTGVASLTVERDESSYFDKYLDEIIYFFETNPFDTVIFEDLDRFDNPHVYMGLRDLNLILNNAPGVVKRGLLKSTKPIRFIYALKDGVFESGLTAWDSEGCRPDTGMSKIPGSNRVKFFDAIVPVIPFLSSINAFEMALPLFDGLLQSEKSRDVLRVVAPHLVDMRVLKELRNEYLLMTNALLGNTDNSPASELGITEEGVLAMAAYKCARPSDYENIACGSSDLDHVYDLHQQLMEKLLEESERTGAGSTTLSSGLRALRNADGNMRRPNWLDFSDCWDIMVELEGHSDESMVTFGSAVSQIVRNPLCCKLIELGYIRQDYALYAATYPVEGRHRAVNYYIHHVRRDIPNLRYRLDDEDAREILDMSKELGWSRKGLLNLDVLSYALIYRKDVARIIIDMVIDDQDIDAGETFDTFIAEKLSEGFSEPLPTFIHLLVSIWDGALDYFFSTSVLELSISDPIVEAVLVSLNSRRDYSVGKCGVFLTDAFERSRVFRKDLWDRHQSDAIVLLAKKCGYSFDDLSVLHGDFRSAVIESGQFTFTRHNILCALPGHRRRLPDLDSIFELAPALYRRITRDFDSFLEYTRCLKDTEKILDGKSVRRVSGLLGELMRGSEDPDFEKLQRCAIEIQRKSVILQEELDSDGGGEPYQKGVGDIEDIH